MVVLRLGWSVVATVVVRWQEYRVVYDLGHRDVSSVHPIVTGGPWVYIGRQSKCRLHSLDHLKARSGRKLIWRGIGVAKEWPLNVSEVCLIERRIGSAAVSIGPPPNEVSHCDIAALLIVGIHKRRHSNLP
jgi:hypothetical protein